VPRAGRALQPLPQKATCSSFLLHAPARAEGRLRAIRWDRNTIEMVGARSAERRIGRAIADGGATSNDADGRSPPACAVDATAQRWLERRARVDRGLRGIHLGLPRVTSGNVVGWGAPRPSLGQPSTTCRAGREGLPRFPLPTAMRAGASLAVTGGRHPSRQPRQPGSGCQPRQPGSGCRSGCLNHVNPGRVARQPGSGCPMSGKITKAS
jgi:hypothetical protein